MQYVKFLLLLLLFQPAAHALAAQLGPGAWQLAQTRERAISLSAAADLVQSHFGGRVLSAQAGSVQGRPIYRIKVLTSSGEVRVALVDAATGRLE